MLREGKDAWERTLAAFEQEAEEDNVPGNSEKKDDDLGMRDRTNVGDAEVCVK